MRVGLVMCVGIVKVDFQNGVTLSLSKGLCRFRAVSSVRLAVRLTPFLVILPSTKLEGAARRALGLGGFLRQKIELAGRGIGADLPVPIVFLVLLQPTQQLLALRRGQVDDGFLNFGQAHLPKLHD
jgi:hypothetical protein